MNGMEKMLETAGGKLGIPADELKELLRKGDMNAIMSKMDKGEAQKLKNAMNNPEVKKMMKGSPEMSEFMSKMADKES
ncbi:MAG: hypothetical protein FWF94_01395 [Oscillospiraceae bacterium]|nr:hypothetical protein [Oscillospiraceae bacterium]